VSRYINDISDDRSTVVFYSGKINVAPNAQIQRGSYQRFGNSPRSNTQCLQHSIHDCRRIVSCNAARTDSNSKKLLVLGTTPLGSHGVCMIKCLRDERFDAAFRLTTKVYSGLALGRRNRNVSMIARTDHTQVGDGGIVDGDVLVIDNIVITRIANRIPIDLVPDVASLWIVG
jgi:hypothetical protein